MSYNAASYWNNDDQRAEQLLKENNSIEKAVNIMAQRSISRLRVTRQVGYIEELTEQREQLLKSIQDARAKLKPLEERDATIVDNLQPYIQAKPAFYIWQLWSLHEKDPATYPLTAGRYNNLGYAALMLDEIACQSAREYLDLALKAAEDDPQPGEAIATIQRNRVLATQICADYQTLVELEHLLADF